MEVSKIGWDLLTHVQCPKSNKPRTCHFLIGKSFNPITQTLLNIIHSRVFTNIQMPVAILLLFKFHLQFMDKTSQKPKIELSQISCHHQVLKTKWKIPLFNLQLILPCVGIFIFLLFSFWFASFCTLHNFPRRQLNSKIRKVHTAKVILGYWFIMIHVLAHFFLLIFFSCLPVTFLHLKFHFLFVCTSTRTKSAFIFKIWHKIPIPQFMLCGIINFNDCLFSYNFS